MERFFFHRGNGGREEDRCLMAGKKKHHYIPKFYLEGFVDPHNKPYIWVYEKGNPTIRKATSLNIAVQKYYYAFPTPEGEKDSDTIENALAAIEGEVAPVFQKIKAQKNLEEKEKYWLAMFLALMMTRVPNFRENVERATSEVMKKTNKILASNPEHFESFIRRFEEKTGEKIKVPLDDLRKFCLSDEYEIVTKPHFSLEIFLSLFEDFAPIFFKMNWRFLIATDDFKFATCDNPLCYVDPTHDPKSWYGFGLGNKNIEVTFPISKDLAFLGTWTKKDGYTQSTNNLVKSVNHRTCLNASRFVYASQKSGGLNRVVQRYKDSAPRLEVR